MTDVNHRRENRKPVNQRYSEGSYTNGYATPTNKLDAKDVAEINKVSTENGFSGDAEVYTGNGSTDYLKKCFHSCGRKSTIADVSVSANISADFSNGRRGMAKAVKGAKKFVNTRIRFHENAHTKRLSESAEEAVD